MSNGYETEIDLLGAEDSIRELPFAQQVISGSAAGMCEHLGLFPIDTIKVFISQSLDSYASY